MLLGFVLYPYVYLTTRAMFITQAANLVEVSRTLGSPRGSAFWRVVLPLARPAIAVGVSLALMEALNDIGASEFLGVRTLTVSDLFDLDQSHRPARRSADRARHAGSRRRTGRP